MDMNSKMDGSAPVSQVLDGVWNIQKVGRTDDQPKDKSKKEKEKKPEEAEEFEDGRMQEEQDVIIDVKTQANEDNSDTDSQDENHSTTKKIDIVI
jgi:hypothetical protein